MLIDIFLAMMWKLKTTLVTWGGPEVYKLDAYILTTSDRNKKLN